jgi:hypothetical protein
VWELSDGRASPVPTCRRRSGSGSLGTAPAWPERPATAGWAFYASRPAVVAKIEATTPRWKWPAWWWTKRFGGWPFSAEWLSAAFDADVAPFYRSFIEVRVGPTKGRVRLLGYGVRGRLHWGELGVPPGERPPDALTGSPVGWVVEMPRERAACYRRRLRPSEWVFLRLARSGPTTPEQHRSIRPKRAIELIRCARTGAERRRHLIGGQTCFDQVIDGVYRPRLAGHFVYRNPRLPRSPEPPN